MGDLGGALIHGTMGNPLSQLCVQLGVATTDNLSDSLLLDANGWPRRSQTGREGGTIVQ
jgi:hypothetical protein